MNNGFLFLLLLSVGLFTLPTTAKAQTSSLPECTDAVCSEIFHNTVLETATLVVWEGRGNILNSHTFDLDSSAILVSQANYAASDLTESTLSSAPDAPCMTGACSTTSSTTYVTETEIVTITTTYTFYNGSLIDVDPSESRTPRPGDDMEQ